MSAEPPAFSLEQYRDRNRLLIISAPSATDQAYQQQQQALAPHSRGLAERDLLVLRLLDDGQSTAEDQTIGATDVAAIRAQFNIPSAQFVAVLVGKDGTAKERYDRPVAVAELFGTIDQMPMRQQEMQQGG